MRYTDLDIPAYYNIILCVHFSLSSPLPKFQCVSVCNERAKMMVKE